MNSTDVVNITQDTTQFSNTVVTNKIQSDGATAGVGYRLYLLGSESTLEVDNLIVRNGFSSNNSEVIYPTYWYYSTNIINSAELTDEGLILNLKYTNNY